MGSRSNSPIPQPGSEAHTLAGQEPRASEVSLRRLLAVVTLTPTQTGVITLDLAAAIEDADAARGDWPTVRNVHVTSAGRLRITDEDDTAPAAPANAGALAAAVVAEFRASVTHGGGHADELHLPTRGEPAELAERIRAAGRAMAGHADDEWIQRARTELGALVTAVRGQPTTPTDGSGQVAGSWPARARPRRPRPASAWPPPGDHAWHRRGHSLPRRSTQIVVVLVALGLLAWWAVPRIGPELQREWNALFSSEPLPRMVGPVAPPPPLPAEEDATDDETDDSGPMHVEPPAPATAAPVTGVSVEPEAGACTPGQQCVVRVEVGLERAGTTRSVDWSLDIVDRCTGEVTTRPGVTVTAQSGWTQVWGNTALDLPDGTALAVVAVTASPASAASEPLLIPTDGTC